MTRIISSKAVDRRKFWVERISQSTGLFSNNSDLLEKELHEEIQREGIQCLIDHLRLCGDIPESYAHDSSEEKLYSKYTDCLLAEAFKSMGFKSLVLRERADVADVDVYAKDYSFVTDAKSFRLSRTAKNQKDFKVQAMDGWKHGKPYAMVVCPIYQLPSSSSQIYHQASTREVCIFTYSHLAMLVSASIKLGNLDSEKLTHEIFKSISTMTPSKSAAEYWYVLNKTMLNFSEDMKEFWKIEKNAAVESIGVAKEVALEFLSSEREKIMRMSHNEALKELVKVYKIESKISYISSVTNNGLLDF